MMTLPGSPAVRDDEGIGEGQVKSSLEFSSQIILFQKATLLSKSSLSVQNVSSSVDSLRGEQTNKSSDSYAVSDEAVVPE